MNIYYILIVCAFYQAYLILVRPNLEYASTVWDLYELQEKGHQNGKHTLYSDEHGAVRFANWDKKTSSVKEMLVELKLPTLQDWRKGLS